MKRTFIYYAIGLLVAQASASLGVDNQVFIDVTVLSNGVPLEDVNIRGDFEQNLDWDSGVSRFASTDTNGYAKVSAKSSNGVCIRLSKNGFYQHYEDWKLYSLILNGEVSTNRVIELKRIKNPIPMYVKWEKIEVPVKNDFVGYDFESGDWVRPHGDGKVADVLFRANYIETNEFNYSMQLEMTFPREFDGIQPMPREYPENQGSKLRSAHEAPSSGYVDCLNMSRSRNGSVIDEGGFSEKDREGYYFRIRSKVDEQGHLVSAQYGKIYGSFKVYCFMDKPDVGLKFLYYFNPDKTRNLEFDPKRNFFLRNRKGRVPFRFDITIP